MLFPSRWSPHRRALVTLGRLPPVGALCFSAPLATELRLRVLRARAHTHARASQVRVVPVGGSQLAPDSAHRLLHTGRRGTGAEQSGLDLSHLTRPDSNFTLSSFWPSLASRLSRSAIRDEVARFRQRTRASPVESERKSHKARRQFLAASARLSSPG